MGRARTLVAEALERGPHAARLDEILLLVSEVVTNAVLHAGTPIELRLEADANGVLVEVTDHCSALPVQRDYDPDASTGRGLGLVATLADRHGVETLPDGKSVWFALEIGETGAAAEGGNPGGEPGAHAPTDWVTLAAPTGDDHRSVRLLDVPVHLFRAMRQHDEALLREHALIALESRGYHPPSNPIDAQPVEEALRRAAERGLGRVNINAEVDPEAAADARDLLDVLASADEQAFEGELLTPPALPEVRWCRVWHLEEIAAQVGGADPRPWAPLDVHAQQTEVARDVEHTALLDALPDAVVACNAQNRVVYANAAALSLLGWTRAALLGKRVTALLPERLRDPYVAAFTDYLVTGGPALRPAAVHLPVLRADGEEVEVDATISADRRREASMFIACLRPAA